MTVLDGDILRVSVNFELGDGTLYQNIYHMIRDGTDVVTDQAHIDAIEVRMESAYGELVTFVRSNVTEQLSFVDRIEFNEITDAWEVVENIGTFVPDFIPTGAGDGLPFQCSPYVIFKTARPKTVGKKFLFPFAEAAQIDSVLVAGALEDVVAYAATILAALAVEGDVELQTGVPRTGIGSWFNFLVAVVPDVLGTQRRRKIGVGA